MLPYVYKSCSPYLVPGIVSCFGILVCVTYVAAPRKSKLEKDLPPSDGDIFPNTPRIDIQNVLKGSVSRDLKGLSHKK